MSISPLPSKEYFRALTILHASLTLGQVLMAAMIYFFFNAEEAAVTGVKATGQSWIYIIGGLTIIGVLMSAQVFGLKIKALREVKDLQGKLDGYRTALILRYALLEVPSLLGIVGYLFTNNLLLLIFSGLIVLLLLVYRPTKERLITDLDLSPSEQNLLV